MSAPQGSRSRDPSPNPGQAPALSRYPDLRAASEAGTVRARAEQLQTLPPDAFSRPANLSQSDTFFETRKIQDMDDFDMPRMPKALLLRDVRYEDWIRFIQVGRLYFLRGLMVADGLSEGPHAGLGRQAANLRLERVIATLSRHRRADRPLEQFVFRTAWRRGSPFQRPPASFWPVDRPDRA
jgi:hypothetical protein